MLGYKHTDESKQKMVERFKDITNHPMYGKKHSDETKKAIFKNEQIS